MKTPEKPKNTTRIIFGNNNPFTAESPDAEDVNGVSPEPRFPGVDPKWVFNHEKQIYEPRDPEI